MTTNGLFITGTDTGTGKTKVSRLLYEGFSKICRTEYVKPVQTGCLKNSSGELTAPDYNDVVKGGASDTKTPAKKVPYRYIPECSPHLAARLSGEHISTGIIHKAISGAGRRADTVIVEGAGGLYVPLNEKDYMIDLIEETGFPAVLVTSPELGTLNHTFLSINAIKNRGIDLAAVVFNNWLNMEENYIYKDNLKMIKKYCAPSFFCEIKYGQKFDNGIKEFCDEIRKRSI